MSNIKRIKIILILFLTIVLCNFCLSYSMNEDIKDEFISGHKVYVKCNNSKNLKEDLSVEEAKIYSGKLNRLAEIISNRGNYDISDSDMKSVFGNETPKTIIDSINFITSELDKIGQASGFRDSWISPDDYKPANSITGASKLQSMGNNIVGYIQFAGSIISVVALMIIGIKYMLGSIEEKATYKETMKPYLIGCLFLFGITTILGIVKSIMENI